MRLVVIESPFAGRGESGLEQKIDEGKNVKYARLCMAACLRRGWAPYASHLLYTQDDVLDDNKPDERKLGIEAGFCWGEAADLRAVCVNRGITPGMIKGIKHAFEIGQRVQFFELRVPGRLFAVTFELTDASQQYLDTLQGRFNSRFSR